MSCPSGKVAFNDRLRALFALVKLKRLDEGQRLPKRAYQCSRCGRWHLTSQAAAGGGGATPKDLRPGMAGP
jgi:hypothetical protein